MLHWHEPEYPQALLQIYDPPVVLYVRGDASILNAPSLSIVGTRRPTVYGTQMAERMGRDLARRGLVIVSGLARGIECHFSRRCHFGAWTRHWRARNRDRHLLPKGKQEAVREGTGAGDHYQRVAHWLASCTGKFPGEKQNHCRDAMRSSDRGREGAQGSLITARLAMEFGREVFGVPGNVTQEVSFAPTN